MTRCAALLAAGGVPVVAIRASGVDGERLVAEAERLRRAAHPGVIQVVHCVRVEDGWELQLERVGRPVGSIQRPSVGRLARIASSVAATLADLHVAGIVHGHLDASTVLIGPDGRVVLSGLGPDDGGGSPAADVAAVGALIRALLPERPSRRPRHRALLAIAARAEAEVASARPSARRLAADLAAIATDAEPTATEPRGDSAVRHQPRHTAPAGRSQLPALLAALVGSVVLVVSAVRLAGGDAAEPPARVEGPVGSSSAGACVRVEGARCATHVEVEGTTVVVDEREYAVGQPGDEVLVGDWDCDGDATAALLRPATGEVFFFRGWAEDEALEVPPAEQVDDAVSLAAEPTTTPGCSRLVVRRAGGARTVLAQEGGG